MQIVVRYWLNKAPIPYNGHRWDDPAWIDHSTHPATRIGLRNAVLAAEDRLAALLQLHPGIPHGCVIFLVQDDESQVLSVHEADVLSEMFEHGEFSWETIGTLLDTQHQTKQHTDEWRHHQPAQTSLQHDTTDARLTAYSDDDRSNGAHHLDIDI